MPKRRSAGSAQYHHGDLRRVLIDTALTLVNQEGTWNFTLREVARRAGVSHAAPYNHFADKAALLADVAARGFDGLRARTEAAARRHPRSPRQQLIAVAVAYVGFGVDRPGHYRLMFGGELAEEGRYPELQRAAEAAFAVLVRTLQDGQRVGEVRAGSLRDQAVAAWSLVHGLTMLLIDGRLSVTGLGGAGSDRYARAVATTLVDGLEA
jgi:AcrR family transcriptional regulator